MTKSSLLDSPRIEIIIAALIAIVSVTFAAAAWRTSIVASSAGDASRHGILDSLKKQAFTNEDWRRTYEEANYAVIYATNMAEAQALENSGDPASADQAANLRKYLLPNLQTMADPLATNSKYEKGDGTYDLQKYFNDLEAESPDMTGLKPEDSFQLAGRYYSEQRWLTVASVLLAISLFWLALAEVSGKRLRLVVMFIGAGVYVLGTGALVVIEIVSILLRGGAL